MSSRALLLSKRTGWLSIGRSGYTTIQEGRPPSGGAFPCADRAIWQLVSSLQVSGPQPRTRQLRRSAQPGPSPRNNPGSDRRMVGRCAASHGDLSVIACEAELKGVLPVLV